MALTGPQKIPFAVTSGASWYGDNYAGTPFEANVGVVHTTEGTTLPSYGGGASAPNITGVPDFAAQKLKWYQHYDVDRSARALLNKAGGVETNQANAFQVELVGTCDPATRDKWLREGREFIFWPDAPDWALKEVAKLVRWLSDNHKIQIKSTVTWKAYPASYGNSSVRLTGAQWNAYYGWLGHQHVPENDHGDPGNIDFDRVIQFALSFGEPTTPPPPQEDPEVPVLISGSNPVDVELEPGVWVPLALDGDGGSFVAGPTGVLSAVVTAYLATDTPADTKIQGVFYLTDPEGGNPSDYLVIDHRGGGGKQFVHASPVPANKLLWFRLRALPADGESVTTLLHRDLKGHHFAV